MTITLRTDSKNKDFQTLINSLDAYLSDINGDEHGFFSQYNSVDHINNVVIIYKGDIAVACGAFKPFDKNTAEVKRMFVHPEYRGKKFSRLILTELETWASELGFHKCVLETSRKLTAAVNLYQNSGYEKIENYGQYIGVATSICFEKTIAH